jgi:hypothetical protein
MEARLDQVAGRSPRGSRSFVGETPGRRTTSLLAASETPLRRPVRRRVVVGVASTTAPRARPESGNTVTRGDVRDGTPKWAPVIAFVSLVADADPDFEQSVTEAAVVPGTRTVRYLTDVESAQRLIADARDAFEGEVPQYRESRHTRGQSAITLWFGRQPRE